MSEPITFQYEVNRDDFLKGFQAHMFRRSQWVTIGIVLGILIACTGSLLLLSLRDGLLASIETLPGAWLFCTIMIVVIVNIYFVLPRISANRMAKQERQTAKSTWVVSRDEITMTSGFGETRTDWGGFKYVIENKDYFILTYTALPNVIQIIPKRAFDSEEDNAQFREFLDENGITAEKPKRRPRILIILLLIFITIISMVVWNFQQQPR